MERGSAIGAIIMVLLLALVIWGRSCAQTDLKKNGVIVNAKVISVLPGGRKSTSLRCEFYYKDEKHEAFSPTTYSQNLFGLVGRTFPAMYSSKSETFEILITTRTFLNLAWRFQIV